MSSAKPGANVQWDVAIIGAGIAGLTAGALLARAGARVIVCEQHVRAGGYCHSWSRTVHQDGRRIELTFDAAVHDITGAHPAGSVRTILGWLGVDELLNWARVSHEYRFPFGTFRVEEDASAYIASLKRRFPADADGLEKLFEIFRVCSNELSAHAVWTGGLPRGPRTAEEMRHFSACCPTLRRHFAAPFVTLRNSLLQSEELRRVVSVLGAYVTDNVQQLLVIHMLPLFRYYFHGGYYPYGGSQALADTLAVRLVQLGGHVCLHAPVSRIVLNRNRVTGLVLGDGTTLRARWVISNADVRQTFGRLIARAELPEQLDRAVKAYTPSNSAFLVFLGLDTDLALASSTIIALEQDGVIVSRPPFPECRAPSGWSTLTLTGLVPAQDALTWKRQSADYRARKRRAGDHLVAMASHHFPELASHIRYREDASPETLRRFVWASDGAAYGSVPATRWPSHHTPIEGLYVVGASAGLGPGVEAVMLGGASLAEQLGAIGPSGRKPVENPALNHEQLSPDNLVVSW